MYIDPLVQRLVAARLDAGLTQREVADAAGISPNTVNACERGYNAPNLASTRKWAKALGFELTLVPAESTKDGSE